MTEWIGSYQNAAVEVMSSATGTGATIAPGIIKTTNPVDLITSYVYSTLSAIADPGVPWNMLTGITGGSAAPGVAGVYQSTLAAGSFNPSFLISGTHTAVAGQQAVAAGAGLINETAVGCVDLPYIGP